MIRPQIIHVVAIVVLLAHANVHAAPAAQPATTAATRPDPHLWAKRNVELIRQATTRNVNPLDSGGVETTLGFSLAFNPPLMRDPYAIQIRKILEAALAQGDRDAKTRNRMEIYLPLLRLPEEQRILRQLLEQHGKVDQPAIRRDNWRRAFSSLPVRPMGEPYDTLIRRAIDQADAVAREAGQFENLALEYQSRAFHALKAEQPEHAAVCIDRMLAIVREHPRFQDPARGNSDAVSPHNIARLLTKAGRQEDLDALIRSLGQEHELDLLLGVATVQLEDGRLDEARKLIETLRPLVPDAAQRLLAAIDGKTPAADPPPTSTTAPTPATSTTRATSATRPIDEARVEALLTAIAHAHARRGDMDSAAHLLIAFPLDDPRASAALPPYTWAMLADMAHKGGHDDAAQRAYARAIDVLPKDSVDEPKQLDERRRFVREAIEVGAYDVAHRLLSLTSPPGAYARYHIAQAHRRRGNVARADELINEAIGIATKDRGEGDVLARIAVDLHAAGDVKRAEELLIDAMDHIEGVDFGFSGTAAIVKAAIEMNRLDLLDRCYASYDDPGEKMLLCIVAARAGLFGVDGDSN